MANLVSPGVSVSIVDESFFIPGRVTTLPVIFIATADEKIQPDGVTPALGTFEHGVYREVTSIRQSINLYGVPRYLESAEGLPFHGDSRNEYGLDALNKFLEIGNRAYVVRANINLDDRIDNVRSLWKRKINDAGSYLSQLAEEYITEYNAVNQLFPNDPLYKTSLDSSELKELIDEVLVDVFDSYSFSAKSRTDGINLFAENFLKNHDQPSAGFAEVVYETGTGFLSRNDITGLEAGQTYGVEIETQDPSTGSGMDLYVLTVDGSDAQTYGDLLDYINTQFGQTDLENLDPSIPHAIFVAGRIRVISGLQGATSSVEIQDGTSGSLPLFSNTNLFVRITTGISGTGGTPLSIFENGFEQSPTGDYYGVNYYIEDGSDPAANPFSVSAANNDFTPQVAEALLMTSAMEYSFTQEFRNLTSLGENDSARRAEIVSRLSAAVNNPNLGIRNPDAFNYNLVACPGYPEVTTDLVRLANDMLEEVFVLGETPFNKPPTGFDGISAWASFGTGDPANRRVTYPGAAYWYGHGLSTNIDGKQILTTSASTALRVFAFNDRETALWWAPAGTQRGQCTHLQATGYVSGTLGGPTEFVEADLNVGERDSLYEFPKNINPITRISGRGILVLGQKTVSPITSSRESINVERFLRYLKRELRRGLFPFLFEPNDKITRENVEFTVSSFLYQFLERRALYDFAVICDETNNTPDRIDRKELWVDVALKPVRAIEFIYVPVRVVATGADIGTGGGVEPVINL